MQVLLQAGPFAVAVTTGPAMPVLEAGCPNAMLTTGPVRTADDDDLAMWVVARDVVESWLRQAAHEGPDCVQEMMIELDLQGIDEQVA